MLDLIFKIVVGALVAGAVIGIAGVIYDSIHDYINRKTVQEHFAKKIRDKLDSGDYMSIDAGLTKEVEIIDVSKDGDVTYVAYEVDGERYGIRSSAGTSLYKSEKFTLKV